MDLIAFGSVYLEIVFGHIHSLPEPGEEIFAEEFAISCGGAVTVATAASQAGAKVGLCTRLGEDLGSRVVEHHCHQKAIDLTPSERVSSRSAGTTVVLNYGGDRAFITHDPCRQPDIDHWREVLRRRRPAWCWLHPKPGVRELLAEARSVGTRIALDVNLEEVAEDPATVLACAHLADIFLPNEDELLRLARARTFTAAIGAAASWSSCVVVKRGSNGAVIVDDTGVTEVTDGIRPVTVRDRTGAGDAFAGGMIGAICRGAPIAEAAISGNAHGSTAVARLGGVGELDTRNLAGDACWVTPRPFQSAGEPGAPGKKNRQRGS